MDVVVRWKQRGKNTPLTTATDAGIILENKTACIARLGAIGDMAQVTPMFRLLKEQGYHVTAYIKPGISSLVIKGNPYIDEVIKHDDSLSRKEAFDILDNQLVLQYDRYIDLSGVVENNLLPAWYNEHFKWDKEKLHERCNFNYTDAQLKAAGFTERGLNPELFLSAAEREWARKFRKKFAKGKFLIIWALGGSSHHKAWAYTEQACKAFLDCYKDVVVVTVGDVVCKLIEWEHPRVIEKSGELPIRKTMALLQEADCVVGTESGVMNLAAGFETPKVLMLSHSSEENLSKYWDNTSSVVPYAPCHPCHKLHHSLSTCETDSQRWPKCSTSIDIPAILNPIDNLYKTWRNKNGSAARAS